MKIYRVAASKDKVQRFNITDPFLIFFIQKYENLIPWDKVKSSEDITAHISSTLLPDLQSKIDPASASNHYLKEIDLEAEYQQNPGDPQVQQAWAIYQQNPETANATILNSINGQKQRIFESWWNYVTKGNDVYAQTPAFAYTILKSIFDKSKANNKSSTMPLNEMAVAALYGKIQNEGGQTQFRIDKQYAKEVSIANQQSTEVVPRTKSKDGNGWIRLPSQQNDPSNFLANVDKLVGYSVPNGWCTGSGMATPYLSKGDFYLYIVDGKAEVAIRMDRDQLAEIQGERNKAPFAYTDEIEEFLKAKNINPSEDYHYQELMEAKKLNENLRDPNKYAKFVQQISDEPRLVEKLSKENRTDPKVVQDVVKAIDQGVRKRDERDYYWHLNGYVAYYSELPEDIRAQLLPDTVEFVIQTVLQSLDVDIQNLLSRSNFFREIDSIPPEILNDPRVNEKIQGTMSNMLKVKPWKMYNLKDETLATFSDSLLEEAKQHPVSQTIDAIRKSDPDTHPEEVTSKGWNEPNIDDYKSYQFGTGRRDFNSDEDEEAYEEDMKEWQKKKDFLDGIGENDIRGIQEVNDALGEAWGRYIEKDLNRYESEAMGSQRDYTDYYEDNGECPGYQDHIREIANNLWHAKIENDPNQLDYAPEDVVYNYREDDGANREYHYTGIWLRYLLNGHMDEINTYNAQEAIENMDAEQLQRLVQGIVSTKDDIDFKDMPVNVQALLYNYEDRLTREQYIRDQKEQGQDDFPFYEEMNPNEFAINIDGRIVPVVPPQQASFMSWYRFSKKVSILRNIFVN